jgi:hypothetical protein
MKEKMKKLLSVVFLLLLINGINAHPIPKSGELHLKYQLQFLAGYTNGLGGQLNFILSDFAQDFPFALKMGYGLSAMNPGNSLDARRIFINDATNGTPEKKGRMGEFKLDFLYNAKLFNLENAYFYGGLRYSNFVGNFNFIGGNEDFDVVQNTFGFGIGLDLFFAMTSKLNLSLSSGTSYYLPDMLKGHDTGYSPDGENINPRNDYTYKDADLAINQPKLEFQLLMGVSYKF